ncbi:MAG TPA: methyltransferase, TIGR04325 family [Flavipsychrobacter sp.]|nr:methyltransferase, TIGR04325 family [Flavipsychrobacter sp.]
MSIKKILKQLIPPIIFTVYRRMNGHPIVWKRYETWEDAKHHSGGYDDQAILEKCRTSRMKVRNGEAAYEIDSVIFDQPQYNWSLIAVLEHAALQSAGTLHVLDFGGSLGTTYCQNAKFLSGLGSLTWSVVEQPQFVTCGREDFEDEVLKFYYSIAECLQERKPNVLLLSGVMQYLDRPYEWQHELLAYGFEHIIIDRTGFSEKDDFPTVQNVPPHIYTASYPCWIFNQTVFLSRFMEKYELITEIRSFDEVSYCDDGTRVEWKGFYLSRKH